MITSVRRQDLIIGMWFITSKLKVCSPFGCRRILVRSLHLPGPLAGTTDQSHSVQVQSQKATHANFRVPHVDLSLPSTADKEEREDRITSLDELQEWLALACMGSQRRVHTSDELVVSSVIFLANV